MLVAPADPRSRRPRWLALASSSSSNMSEARPSARISIAPAEGQRRCHHAKASRAFTPMAARAPTPATRAPCRAPRPATYDRTIIIAAPQPPRNPPPAGPACPIQRAHRHFHQAHQAAFPSLVIDRRIIGDIGRPVRSRSTKRRAHSRRSPHALAARKIGQRVRPRGGRRQGTRSRSRRPGSARGDRRHRTPPPFALRHRLQRLQRSHQIGQPLALRG